MQKFPQQGHLGRHLKMHNEQKSNKCNQCSYAFSRAGHLRTHLKIHTDANPDTDADVDTDAPMLMHQYFFFKLTHNLSKVII